MRLWGAGTGSVMVQVKHEACCGEIVLLTTTPFLTMLQTNCFVRQFSSDWATHDTNHDEESQAF